MPGLHHGGSCGALISAVTSCLCFDVCALLGGDRLVGGDRPCCGGDGAGLWCAVEGVWAARGGVLEEGLLMYGMRGEQWRRHGDHMSDGVSVGLWFMEGLHQGSVATGTVVGTRSSRVAANRHQTKSTSYARTDLGRTTSYLESRPACTWGWGGMATVAGLKEMQSCVPGRGLADGRNQSQTISNAQTQT